MDYRFEREDNLSWSKYSRVYTCYKQNKLISVFEDLLTMGSTSFLQLFASMCVEALDTEMYDDFIKELNKTDLDKALLIGEFIEKGLCIEDPWYTDNFELVYEQLDIAINKFIEKLKNEGKI